MTASGFFTEPTNFRRDICTHRIIALNRERWYNTKSAPYFYAWRPTYTYRRNEMTAIKRCCALALAVLMILTALPVTAFAETAAHETNASLH